MMRRTAIWAGHAARAANAAVGTPLAGKFPSGAVKTDRAAAGAAADAPAPVTCVFTAAVRKSGTAVQMDIAEAASHEAVVRAASLEREACRPSETFVPAAGATPWLSVILPAYNEEAALAEAVDAHRAVLERIGIPGFELVVVDDGSQDGTATAACELVGEDQRVRLLRLETNRGQAMAILAGFAAARGRWLVHNGVDLPLAPAELARLLHLLAAADASEPTGPAVVVVERQDRSAYGFTRKLLSWANISLVRLLFDSPVRDHNFVQFYRRDVLAAVRPASRGVSTVTLELVVRAHSKGFGVLAVPAAYRPRRQGTSSVRWRTAWHACRETLRLRWLLWRERP